MRRFSFTGTFLLTLVLIMGFGWLGLTLIGRSFVSDGDAAVEGLSAATTIVRDDYGIPYITAENESDAWCALGYAHAQDRLWQMDLMRRAGEGRLSEIFGRKTIPFDALLRTVGFKRVSEEIYRGMPSRPKELLQAYCRGVNAYIEKNKGRYPIEFDALAYVPEKWTPVQSVMISRLLAWELNTSFWTDIVYGEIQGIVDSTRFEQILPWSPSDAPTIIPGGQKPEPLLEKLLAPPVPLDTVAIGDDSTAQGDSSVRGRPRSGDSVRVRPASFKGKTSGLNALIAMEHEMRGFLGIDGSHIGSNGWVVSGKRTASGSAMLANDPHLTHTAPGRWYQAVVSWPGNTVAGVTLPGLPFVVIGRNKNITWGITSMMADETDFYIEVLDTTRRNMVLHDGAWEKLRIVRDTIAVKDSASVPIMIRISRHGPLISDVDPYIGRSGGSSATDPSRAMMQGSAVAMRWTGNDPSQEMAAWHGIDNAKNLAGFTSAVRLGGVPSLSFLYADTAGTIAFIPVARIPNRGPGSMNIPYPGTDSRFNWKGYIAAEKLPTLVNPPEGFIASANNKLSNSLSFPVGELWEDPSRSTRLVELLKDGNTLSVTDFMQMQGDVVSPHMRYLVDFLIRAFPDSARQGPAVRSALERLRRWNGSMREDSPEAAITAAWLQEIIEETYHDELGDELYRHFLMMAQMPIRSLRYHVLINSRWFDNIKTPEKIETRDDILRTSLGKSLTKLNAFFGNWDIAAWRYGKLHTLTFTHPFSQNEKLREIVNIGPFEVGGCNTTLNNGEWDFNAPYNVHVGASMRQIVDLGDTTNYMRSVITSGASGQPLNRYYKNQTVLWLSNGYVGLRRVPPPASETSSTTRLGIISN